MALTEIYVDPSIAGDSGTGTIGDPFGDLEYAIEQTTFDTTNGTRVNIKAGTDEIVAAELGAAMANTGTTVAWAPSEAAPAIFQGYTTTAGDGGIGGISGGGSVSIFFTLTDHIHCIDLHMHNCGSALICQIDNYSSVIRCEVDNTTGTAVFAGTNSIIRQCNIHNYGLRGIQLEGSIASYNILDGLGATPLYGIELVGNASTVYRNIIRCEGAMDGIVGNGGNYGIITNNSIFSNGGTGAGIGAVGANHEFSEISNNLIEGFSGTGGIGMDLASANSVRSYGGNSVYDCATAYTAITKHIIDDLGSNETLTVSPFTNATGDDFSPVDTGSVKEGSLPAEFPTV